MPRHQIAWGRFLETAKGIGASELPTIGTLCFRFEIGDAFDVEIVDYHLDSDMTIRIEDLPEMGF